MSNACRHVSALGSRIKISPHGSQDSFVRCTQTMRASIGGAGESRVGAAAWKPEKYEQPKARGLDELKAAYIEAGKVKYVEAVETILRRERDDKRKQNHSKGEHNVRGKSASSCETNWQDGEPGASCEATAGKDNDWTVGKSWADSKSRNDSPWTDSRTSADSKAWTESASTDSRASADSTAWTDSWNWKLDCKKWKRGSKKDGGWPPRANKSCDVMRKR